ncbi:MAG: NUDIX hydrolase [Bacteroidaceae bacterium]|nr:NUDIX hydrolase [Bacteroidaceae bacterium]
MLVEKPIDKSGEYKVLKSEYLHKRPWLTARVDSVQLPNGIINDEYYVLEYPDWVNVIAITEDGHFVMERQYRHALGNTCYELPCGVMEEGESPLESAKRELEEETGYGGGQWEHLMDISPNPGSQTNMAHCFVAKGVKKVCKPHLDRTEDIEAHLLEKDEVKYLMDNNLIIQALMLAPLWRFFSDSKML